MSKGKRRSAPNTADIKNRFGTLFRAARDRLKISRATLSHRLGISPKTIQSWEMGRTFVEDLSLVPLIEAELGISFHDIVEVALNSDADSSIKDASGRMTPAGHNRITMPLLTPEPLDLDADTVSAAYKAIPEVAPATLETKVRELKGSQILGHIPVPDEWCPRGGVVVATRIHDKNMELMYPKDTILILDLRHLPLEKSVGRTVILKKAGKSSPIIRIVTNDLVTGKYFGTCAGGSRKGLVSIDTDAGDRILARVVGFMAKPSIDKGFL